ncbi:DUF72 domain-containing protein [Photobacterium chitinilyticum]|uniref:DUF72 domain-containing protein n=1 Tax=Photobacterium chitinilyticum TaxID=2485123 RepID=A0A444JQ97_9GAMM|nr:DUF72 domain-containing protein [Photobacterium chitinilyticum]RWX55264.1 DUF72 domain-containing protein [Photobacterium chitinilyticum]
MPIPPARPLLLGLAMWSHNHWQQSLYGTGCKTGDRLARYAEVFDTVEGNTTFYAPPAITTVKKWHQATPDDFRFTFKLPATITHQNQLMHCDQLLADFFTVMSPLELKTGLWKIQLPAHFGPQALPALEKFLRKLPAHLTFGVEVRHPAFFAKGEEEKALNRLLVDQQANRIIMDSRPVFAAPPTSEAVIDAHQKKPHVPVHAIATANNPMIRFIGHPDDLSNDAFFANWLKRLPSWLADGKQPYLFIHTPDNNQAPELAIRLYRQLQQQVSLSPQLPDIRLPPEAEASPQFDLL